MADSEIWGRIERRTREAFGELIDQSASRLVDSLDCGARYLAIDERRQCLIFDRKAFLYGVIIHGLRGKTSDLPDEADLWLASWFRQHSMVQGSAETTLRAGNEAGIEQAFTDGYRLILSNSMGQVLVEACDYAQRTSGRPMADLRHLTAAFMRHKGKWPEGVSWSPSVEQIADWSRTLLQHLRSQRGLSDNMNAWEALLLPAVAPDAQGSPAPTLSATVSSAQGAGTASGTSSATAAETTVDTRIPLTRVNTDSPDESTPGDPLNIDPDVSAFARLIAAHDTALPLSIGIFGDWGTGKSTFMRRLEKAIDDLVQRKHKYFAERIIHIRFNAWQFADANLWASLTAEFFEQLRIGGHAKQIGDRYDKLVERVNSHVHALSENAAAARDALAESKKALVDAQQARDEAVKDVARATGEELSQSTLDAAGEAFEKHRSELADLLGIATDQDGGAALEQFLDVAKDLRSIGGQIAVIWKATWHGGWRRVFATLALLSMLCVIGLGYDWIWGTVDRPAELLSRFGPWTAAAAIVMAIVTIAVAIKIANGNPRPPAIGHVAAPRRKIWATIWHSGWPLLFFTVTVLLLLLLFYFAAKSYWGASLSLTTILPQVSGWTALATLGTTVAAIAPAVKFAAGILRSTAGFADRLDKISSERQKKVLQSEIALRAAAAEAKARQEAVDRASRALARYVGPDSKANPPRLLRYVLEDFPDTKEMEKEIGLISRARRLFESVDAIVQQERTRRASGDGEPDLDVPDRIVLYIDDLDRCTPDQVYAVLQAIHLLLAFELFVVIVGVDVRWIEEALGKQTGLPNIPEGVADPGVVERYELARRIKTIRYLEKIFQLPFWLRPLSTDGLNGGTYGRYVRDLSATFIQTEAGLVRLAAPDEIPLARRALTENIPPAVLAAAPGWTPSMTSSPLMPQEASEEKEAEATADQFNPMQITDAEISFLASPSIGRLAAKDPRAVKRLINVYRIVRASMTPQQREQLVGQGSAPTYPIAIFLVAVDVGQPAPIADALYQGLKTSAADAVFDLAEIVRESQRAPADLTDKPLARAFREQPALAAAWTDADKIRWGATTPMSTCLQLAQAIRRYSFNKY